MKRLQQQALFKESEQPVAERTTQASDEQVSQQMDEEEMLQEAYSAGVLRGRICSCDACVALWCINERGDAGVAATN